MIPYLPLEIISNIINQSVIECKPYHQSLLQERNEVLCLFTLVNSNWRILALEKLVEAVRIVKINVDGFCRLLDKESRLVRRVKYIDVDISVDVDFSSFRQLLQIIQPLAVYGTYVVDDESAYLTESHIKSVWSSSLLRLNFAYNSQWMRIYCLSAPFTSLRQLAVSVDQLSQIITENSILFPSLDTLSISINAYEVYQTSSITPTLGSLATQIKTFQIIDTSTFIQPINLSTVFKSLNNVEFFSTNDFDLITRYLNITPSLTSTIQYVELFESDLDDSWVEEEILAISSTTPPRALSKLTEFRLMVLSQTETDGIISHLIRLLPKGVKVKKSNYSFENNWFEDLDYLLDF